MFGVLKAQGSYIMPAHIDDDKLERYSLGRLPEDEAASVEEHLLTCTECQDRLTETDEYTGVMRESLAKMPPDKPAKAPLWGRLWPMPKVAWVPALAAAALAVIVITVPENHAGPQTVTLLARRGPEQPVTAEAGEPLLLQLERGNLSGGRPYRVEIANSSGTVVWYGMVTWKSDAPSVHVPRPLGPGTYWVRLYDMEPATAQIREYGLLVR